VGALIAVSSPVLSSVLWMAWCRLLTSRCMVLGGGCNSPSAFYCGSYFLLKRMLLNVVVQLHQQYYVYVLLLFVYRTTRPGLSHIWGRITCRIYRVFQKRNCTKFTHHNFATIRHRVMRFSAKCSERNSLHDKGHCLKSLWIRLLNILCFAAGSELFETKINSKIL